ncbi:response regulator transcription factor [Granulosicoccus antarcticus]|uniref:Response regulator MprA n=1 Tax=Granulosicoccus antarcticus IMCC3135 TaxID=1192854 RepID=A0A2Z2NV64_9GAMM|nr:response regulator transcription factor [Granulosicoccus antarcticus]ASJ73608.1 Response regulator MprA [Granulosicoccus antarcticus IMCC3135]
MRILIIEDSQQIMETVVDYLELEGLECDCAYDGQQALALAATECFDVIVADIMMARLDGVSAVRQMREKLKVLTPVIFLTARDSLADKQAAFEAGGDDYLVKPFAMQELLLRIHALARRREVATVRKVEFLGVCCNLSTHEIFWQGRPVKLGRLQRQVLAHLLQQAPAMVSREALIEAVWGDQPPATDSLRSHVYGLRTSLKSANIPISVETVHGEGYRLISL